MLAVLPLFAALVLGGPIRLAEAEPGMEEPVRILVNAGRAELAAGSYEQAITHLTVALEKQPGDEETQQLLASAKQHAADAYVTTGKQLLAERKYADAMVAFNNALDVVPGHAMAKRGREAAQKWPAAEAYCKAARESLGHGEWDAGIAYYEKAYELTHDAGIQKWLTAAKAAKARQP